MMNLFKYHYLQRLINPLVNCKRCIHLSTVISTSKEAPANVFDRKSKLMQRDRAASDPDAKIYDYLKDEVSFRLVDRIHDIDRKFKLGLDLGCGRGSIEKNITDGHLSHLHMVDMSPKMLHSAVTPENVEVTKTIVDEEQPLPYKTDYFDIVLSNLNLHWVNNLPACLKEVNRVLKKDGVFIASMFAGDTLFQLRSSLLLAELERDGGFSMHISPFIEVTDISALLTNAGFTLLTIDKDDISVGYPSMFELMWDLQGMGENNATYNRTMHLHRDTILAAAAIYNEMYGKEEGIPATFEILYMIGWKPDPSKKPNISKRGSGEVSMKDINRLNELIKEHGMQGKVKFMEEMSTDKNKDDK